jgi:hypothetical protein
MAGGVSSLHSWLIGPPPLSGFVQRINHAVSFPEQQTTQNRTMKEPRVFPSALFVLSLAVMPTCVIADSIVWDFGPAAGLLTPPEGGSSVWVNMSNGQNFSDSVSFPTGTSITGYNLFTAWSHSVNFNNSFCVRFWADSAGQPGSLLNEVDLTSNDAQFMGNFKTISGRMTDVYQISLRFAPVLLSAHTTYWVGASGLNDDVGTYGVAAPGDGRCAEMWGANASLVGSQFGDLSFQLVGVPEPSAFALLVAGSALVLFRKTLERRDCFSWTFATTTSASGAKSFHKAYSTPWRVRSL